MRYNTAKQKMLAGQPAIGGAACLGSPMAALILAREGYDYILLDDQHGGAWSPDDILTAFQYIRLAGNVPMARVQKNDFGLIGAMLDRGALGIIVPMVNSPEEAHSAAHAMRYPPQGGRSIGAYGVLSYGPDYEDWANDEVFLAVQIESIQAVECVEDILSVPGVDGCWVGPADLARSMGVDPRTPEGCAARDKAILRVLEACHKTGKVPGIASGKEWADKGFLFVTPSLDWCFLTEGAQRDLAVFR